MRKIEVYSLILEVTRRCNMTCRHCLRGECQNVDMPHEIIDRTFNGISSVDHITFSGGEPSMNIDAIRYTLEVVKERNISVNSFYLVTNGKVIPDGFLEVMNDWYAYCLQGAFIGREDQILSCEEVMEVQQLLGYDDILTRCGCALSSDIYHDPIPMKNLITLNTLPYYRTDKFVRPNTISLINMGRAMKLTGVRKYDLDPTRFDLSIEDNQVEELYINALGQICACCDLSYDYQNVYNYGSVLEEDWTEKLEDED